MRARHHGRTFVVMNSCLYECTVMHHRLEPKEHQFDYRIFLAAFDLDEIDGLAAQVPVFSRNRRNLYAFFDRDHLMLPGLEKGGVRENLAAYLAGQGMDLPGTARVLLITLPRVLGYVFNPVSFYFCFSVDGAPLCAVAEVGNTFGEQKLYYLPELSGGNLFHRLAPKRFYVSPFSELDLVFDLKLRVPGEQLDIHIDDRVSEAEGGRRILLSALTGRRVALTTPRLLWYLVKYPFITVRVILLIHWHALWLWRKRLPWYRKAADPHLQEGVLRRHSSIAEKTL
jgi:uncharacterized protein